MLSSSARAFATSKRWPRPPPRVPSAARPLRPKRRVRLFAAFAEPQTVQRVGIRHAPLFGRSKGRRARSGSEGGLVQGTMKRNLNQDV